MQRRGLLLLLGLLVFWAALAPGYGKKPSPGLPDLCKLQAETGPCRRAAFRRYYYDINQWRCLEFMYGGCGGNLNNFQTKEECERVCMRRRPAAANATA